MFVSVAWDTISTDTRYMDPPVSISDHPGGVDLGPAGTHPMVLGKTLMLKMHYRESEKSRLIGEQRNKVPVLNY